MWQSSHLLIPVVAQLNLTSNVCCSAAGRSKADTVTVALFRLLRYSGGHPSAVAVRAADAACTEAVAEAVVSKRPMRAADEAGPGFSHPVANRLRRIDEAVER
jgi:hypothetical protein